MSPVRDNAVPAPVPVRHPRAPPSPRERAMARVAPVPPVGASRSTIGLPEVLSGDMDVSQGPHVKFETPEPKRRRTAGPRAPRKEATVKLDPEEWQVCRCSCHRGHQSKFFVCRRPRIWVPK